MFNDLNNQQVPGKEIRNWHISYTTQIIPDLFPPAFGLGFPFLFGIVVAKDGGTEGPLSNLRRDAG